jgi:hypothetical protein
LDTSGSIGGRSGSGMDWVSQEGLETLGGYGKQALGAYNIYNQIQSGKEARKNIQIQRGQIQLQNNLAKLQASNQLEKQAAQRLMNQGASSSQAYGPGAADAQARMARYGL